MSIINFPLDPQWEHKKNQYREHLRSFVIDNDINPGRAKELLARIDVFFSEVRLEFSEVEAQKEYIDSLIRELEREYAEGRNESTRKKAATLAVKNYQDGDRTVNLYEIQRMINERYAFLKGVIDVLNAKQARLITISGLLKIESNLFPYSNGGEMIDYISRGYSNGAANMG